jgi:hypothetical protein
MAASIRTPTPHRAATRRREVKYPRACASGETSDATSSILIMSGIWRSMPESLKKAREPGRQRSLSLPGSDDCEAVFDDFIEGAIGVDHGISLCGKRIAQLGFHAVRGGSLEVSVIGSRFDARRARGIACVQEEEPSSG